MVEFTLDQVMTGRMNADYERWRHEFRQAVVAEFSTCRPFNSEAERQAWFRKTVREATVFAEQTGQRTWVYISPDGVPVYSAYPPHSCPIVARLGNALLRIDPPWMTGQPTEIVVL